MMQNIYLTWALIAAVGAFIYYTITSEEDSTSVVLIDTGTSSDGSSSSEATTWLGSVVDAIQGEETTTRIGSWIDGIQELFRS